MNISVLLLVSIAAVTVAYFTYGRLLSRWLGVDPSRKTPAHTMQDGVDYVPARAPVLLGHHFASIAGAGPIVGPILAGLAFGWFPVWLWILIGVVFIGAVHDFSALLASVRHQGKSIGEVIEKYLGLTGKRLFLIFAWCTLLLVVAVFLDVVATMFDVKPAAATASLLFVALAIVFGLALHSKKVPLWLGSAAGVAILFLCVYAGYKAPLRIYGSPAAEKAAKIGAIVLLTDEAGEKKEAEAAPAVQRSRSKAAALAGLAEGESAIRTLVALRGKNAKADRDLKALEKRWEDEALAHEPVHLLAWLKNPDAAAKLVREGSPALTSLRAARKSRAATNQMYWKIVLLVYIFIASVTPVWILLQPRDYLNSYLLYALMLGAVVGILLAPAGAKQIRMEEFTGFVHPVQGPLFPMLFVLVACGAISGFHSLVSSGTTAKQLDREADARPIGFGGMLIEGVLAVVALGAVAAMAPGEVKVLLAEGKKIGGLFSLGVGRFVHEGMGFIPVTVASTFAALAVSAFALTSLDTGTRLGRFAFQELTAPGGDETRKTFLGNRFVATAVTAGGGAAIVFTGNAWTIWPAFGAANQLLAALALLAVAVWLVARARPSVFVKIPMVFMFVVTLSALVVNIVKRYQKGEYVLVAIQAVLLVFAVILVGLAWKSLFRPAEPKDTTPQAA